MWVRKIFEKVIVAFLLFYPTLIGSKTPTQNAAKAKKLGGGGLPINPIGSTNNQWG